MTVYSPSCASIAPMCYALISHQANCYRWQATSHPRNAVCCSGDIGAINYAPSTYGNRTQLTKVALWKALRTKKRLCGREGREEMLINELLRMAYVPLCRYVNKEQNEFDKQETPRTEIVVIKARLFLNLTAYA